jgi:hypothetical protein
MAAAFSDADDAALAEHDGMGLVRVQHVIKQMIARIPIGMLEDEFAVDRMREGNGHKRSSFRRLQKMVNGELSTLKQKAP